MTLYSMTSSIVSWVNLRSSSIGTVFLIFKIMTGSAITMLPVSRAQHEANRVIYGGGFCNPSKHHMIAAPAELNALVAVCEVGELTTIVLVAPINLAWVSEVQLPYKLKNTYQYTQVCHAAS